VVHAEAHLLFKWRVGLTDERRLLAHLALEGVRVLVVLNLLILVEGIFVYHLLAGKHVLIAIFTQVIKC